jgi:site-specific DNA-methyltransferase (adenine-specific)/modification methylase
MQGEIAQLGLHDPPYGLRSRVPWGLGSGKQYGRTVAPHGLFAPVYGDDKPFSPQHLLVSGSIVVLWGANHYADKLPSSPAWIVWDKRVTLPSNDHSDAEVAWVSTGNTIRTLKHRWMGMIRDSERGIKRVHPTQKPIWLMEQVIEKYTKPNDLVTDWYAGSGTTLIASHKVNRRCYGMEIEPNYCTVIIERWQAHTGQKAVLS